MKPYEEIDFSNGFLRWIREDGMYVCRMTEEQMAKIKALHEAPRTWVGLTGEEITQIIETGLNIRDSIETALDKLKEKNND
jgi:hypothetical protein